MGQRHRYDYRVDIEGPTAAATVVRMVGKDKRVLEIGAGPGSITRCLHGQGGCRVTAIEIDEDAIERLSPLCERVYQCDLNDRAWNSVLSQENRFEVVVAADVIEHLYDPWTTLKMIRELVDVDGCVVASLPHIGHNAVIACLLQEDMRYQDWGLLDKSHIRFFCIENIQQLFDDAGFKIVEAEFIVKTPKQTELANYWRKVSPELKQILMGNPFGMVYQVVVKAKRDSSPERGLRLASMPVPGPGSVARSYRAPLATRLAYFMKENIIYFSNYRTWSRLRNALYRMGLRF